MLQLIRARVYRPAFYYSRNEQDTSHNLYSVILLCLATFCATQLYEIVPWLL